VLLRQFIDSDKQVFRRKVRGNEKKKVYKSQVGGSKLSGALRQHALKVIVYCMYPHSI